MSHEYLYLSPECCDEMKKHNSIFLGYSGDGDIWYGLEEEENLDPADKQKMYDLHKPMWLTTCWDSEYRSKSVTEAKYCPFCAAPVPPIKRRKTDEKIASVTDGGYYCDTCGENGNVCECHSPVYAWEVDHDKK